ncbi:thioredoxin-like protein [Aspergillus karnatakaensis]|uniref:DsbA family oxidoreductase n=1 Tax=Aspergillus karnatakaensis TaxID=1810916 RepID=UPI003CCD69B1
MTNFIIQITSDAVCPWCYVGYRRLTTAITTHATKFPTDTFTITWAPFYLNASSPPYPGVNKQAFYKEKFGPSRTDAILSRLAAVGESEGIKFSFGGNLGRTRDAHRVIWLAGKKEKELREAGKEKDNGVEAGKIGGIQSRVVERLFAAYFEQEKNITDPAVLVEAAVEGGLQRGEVEGLLNDKTADLGGKEVDAEAEGARRQFVSGVPYFLVQGQYAIEGADEPETFLEVFRKIKGN